MTNYLNAVNDLIEYYGNRATFIMGHSRGSIIALIATLRNPYILGCAAVFCSYPKEGFPTEPNYDWQKNGYRHSMRDLPPGGGEEIVSFKLPYSFYEDQSQYNITKELQVSNKPKLFILGKRDETAKPEMIRETFAIAGYPKKLVEIDSDHNYRLHPKLIKEVNSIVEDFLKEINL